MRKKTIDELKLTGTYRADRNGRRTAQTDDDPKPMAPLEGEALVCWEHIVPSLVELRAVSSLDSCELTALCQWWAEYRRWVDDDSVNRYKATVCAATAYKQFRGLAAKFYLTPADRVGMPCGVQVLKGVRRWTDEAERERQLEELMGSEDAEQ